ncbi:MAG TPA: hypothetical protein VMH92_11375 [Acidocella sp.]|nr:hypothetical protein [Acidocella sp.]
MASRSFKPFYAMTLAAALTLGLSGLAQAQQMHQDQPHRITAPAHDMAKKRAAFHHISMTRHRAVIHHITMRHDEVQHVAARHIEPHQGIQTRPMPDHGQMAPQH